MSHNDVNIEEQKKRHAGPLIGIGLSVVFGAVLLFLIVSTAFFKGEDPGDGTVQTEGTTGGAVATE